jgi:FkbM family methyltransferase
MKLYAHDPRFIFNGRDNSFPDAVVVREIWCENVYELYDGDLTDTGIVVDIGANIGSFSLFAASLGAKKVIAVEPEPHNLELLRQNIKENQANVPDCEFVIDDHAVGRDRGVGYITDEHGDSKVTDIVVENSQESYNGKSRVRIISLDQLFANHNLEFIDVLKIDIEGLEGDVIMGASQDTLNLCRYITLEYDRRANDLGAIVERISKTHQIKYVGAQGGMLFAKRY